MKEQRSRHRRRDFFPVHKVLEITKQMLRRVSVAELDTDDSRRSSSSSSSSSKSSCWAGSLPCLSMTPSVDVWVTPSMTSLQRSRLPLQPAWLSVLFQFRLWWLRTSEYFSQFQFCCSYFFRCCLCTYRYR